METKSNDTFATMKKNLGKTDAIIRLIISAVIIILFFTNVITGALGITLLAIAGVLVLTSLVGFCPIWKILGVSTRK